MAGEILIDLEHQRLMRTLVAIGHRLSLAKLRCRELEDEARCQASLMNAFLEGLSEGVVIVDAARRIVLMNATAREIGSMYDEDDGALLRPLNAFLLRLDGSAWPAEENPVSRALRGECFGSYEAVLVHSDGTTRQVAVGSCGVRDSDGNVALAILVYRDLT